MNPAQLFTTKGWTREEIAEILTESGHPTAADDPRLTDDFCTEFPPFKREADTMTIQELAVAPVAGNYYDDRHLWDAAHAIAADEMQPMPYRLASLAKMNELTGEDDPCDEAALREYLEFTTAAA